MERAGAPGWGVVMQRVRDGLRGLLLPLLVAPLWFDLVIEAFRSRPSRIVGDVLGIALVWLAVAVLRRGGAGDTHRASVLVGVAAGLAAGLAANIGWLPALLAGFGAYAGMRLFYDGSFVEAPAPPEPVVEAAPVPPTPESIVIGEAEVRLTRLRATAARVAEPRLTRVADAMAGVLDDLRARPDRLPLARRFLVVHLDGVDRIAERMVSGAEAPQSLGPLLIELERTAGELRLHLRAEENAALEVQVKVLSDRLREEGYQ